MTPTPQQQAILNFALSSQSNIMIKAMAGCAKTSTLAMLANAMPSVPSLAVAFNKRIADEFKDRFPSHFTCKTLNSVGNEAWKGSCGRWPQLDRDKTFNLTKDRGLLYEAFTEVMAMVNKAKTIGFVPPTIPGGKSFGGDWKLIHEDCECETPLEELQPHAEDILRQSIVLARSGTIDFADQIYMPCCFGGLWTKYSLVMVDEAQDLSPMNHYMVSKIAKERLIVVGDPHQAIYQFRGAAANSMDILARQHTFTEFPLTKTFRCGKEIVRRQLPFVPAFEAAESNPAGTVLELGPWSLMEIPLPSTFICRNNAPLLSLAFKLLRARLPFSILGRDFGKSLEKLLKKLKRDPWPSTLDALREWKQGELAKHPTRAEQIGDKAASLEAIIEETSGFTEAKDWIASVFTEASNGAGFTLSSGHKSKGLEWDTVVHLDPWRIPSKHAFRAEARGEDGPMESERNLKYVIETRPRYTLLLASLSDLKET